MFTWIEAPGQMPGERRFFTDCGELQAICSMLGPNKRLTLVHKVRLLTEAEIQECIDHHAGDGFFSRIYAGHRHKIKSQSAIVGGIVIDLVEMKFPDLSKLIMQGRLAVSGANLEEPEKKESLL